MRIITFASIYIGSYELSLKIFEISQKNGVKLVDHIRTRVELGKEVYRFKKIGTAMTDRIIEVLLQYLDICSTYKTDEIKLYTGSVIRDAQNEEFALHQIQMRTGQSVKILSNSEHRFLGYKAVAFHPEFERLITEGAAIVDVGGGSLQITLFEDGNVITTQQLVIGTMRMREQLKAVRNEVSFYQKQVEEIINKDLFVFESLYLKKYNIKHVIFIGDYISEILHMVNKDYTEMTVPREKFIKALKKFYKSTTQQIATELNLSDDRDELLIPYMVLYRRLAEDLQAEYIWSIGKSIIEGVAYNYAQENKLIKSMHDFNQDIRSAANSIAKRYQTYSPHVEALTEMSGLLFDTMKKEHGMNKRDRLLLEIAGVLHDCGKYVSLANAPECSFDIIMKSEILGLTHAERQTVAYIVLYNTYLPEGFTGEITGKMDLEQYLKVCKLAAILRISNAMDRSHRQKFKNVRARVKDRELIITVETSDEMILEKALFDTKSEFFEHVYGIHPKMIEKKTI